MVLLRCEQGGRWTSNLFQIPSEELDWDQRWARQKIVDAGEATALAWEKEHQGQVMCLPSLLYQSVRGSH